MLEGIPAALSMSPKTVETIDPKTIKAKTFHIFAEHVLLVPVVFGLWLLVALLDEKEGGLLWYRNLVPQYKFLVTKPFII